jgi:hypothetical protein
MADTDVVLTQNVRQIRVAFQDHVLDASDRQNGEHLSHDLVDQDAGRGCSWGSHGIRYGTWECVEFVL